MTINTAAYVDDRPDEGIFRVEGLPYGQYLVVETTIPKDVFQCDPFSGGFVGLHNAFGAEYNWPYYEGLLGNANFYNHAPNRAGTVELIGKDASTEGVPARFDFQDEWYNLTPFPTNVKFLAKVDTGTLRPLTAAPHPGHAGFHPVAWCQYYDGGRAWLSTLGHNTHSFAADLSGPGAEAFQRLVVQGVKSAMGLIPFCTAE